VLSCAEEGRSTHCHERNPFVALIAGSACALRVEDRPAVHQELILMVTVGELHLNEPPAILTASHGMRSRIPPIEIACHINRLRRRGLTIEIDRLGHSFCRIRIGYILVKHGIHKEKVAKADVDCGSLAAIARPRFRIRVAGLLRATPTEDCGNECRRTQARMNCSKTSRSAWNQSFKAVPWRHPPTHQSWRARRSICSWTPRCSSAVKTTIRFLSGLLIERFFMGHYMRWLEKRTRQMPGAGINVKKPWRGGFWICPKEWFDTNAAIQGTS
jgi:hypothetical protein